MGKTKREKTGLFLIILASVIFTVILCFCTKFGDDANPESMLIAGGSFMDYWDKCVFWYYNWSNRFFVNLLVLILTDAHIIFFALVSGFSFFILIYSFAYLTETKDPLLVLLIITLTLLFPFVYLLSAGWISTMITYFCPIAFASFSFIPIKKISKGEKISPVFMVLYTLSLIFAAQNEQAMIIITGIYSLAVLYFFLSKTTNFYIIFNWLISIAICIVFATCPGLAKRNNAENVVHNPLFGMFDFVDKMELGFTDTLRFLFFDHRNHNYFVLLIFLVFALCLTLKYKNVFISIFSLLPILISLIGEKFIPLTPSLGLIYPENAGSKISLITFFALCILIVFMIIEILLLSTKKSDFILAFFLIFLGFSTRMAVALSPSFFLSGFRTCAIMSFFIILASLLVLIPNFKEIKIPGKLRPVFAVILICICAYSFENLLHLALTVGK